MVENLSSQFVNCKLIINKKNHTGFDSFCLAMELQNVFRTDVDDKSQTKNQNDVQKEILNEHDSSLILENILLPIKYQHTKFK